MKRALVAILVVGIVFLVYWFRIWIPFVPFNSIPRAALEEIPTSIYTSRTNPSETISVENDAQLRTLFQEWLKRNQYGWSADYNTYVNGIEILARNVRLIVFPESKFVIFAYPVTPDRAMQITKEMKPEDAAAFKAEFDRIGIKRL